MPRNETERSETATIVSNDSAPQGNDQIIYGLGNNTDILTVQKSRPLEALCKSDLGLAEFKLLDLYLSRINSHNPAKRTVVIEKGEIETALGLTRITAENLSTRLYNIGQAIKIPDTTNSKGFRLMWLFEEAKCVLDDKGQWTVTMSASPKAMEYFFNVEQLGYFRYRLNAVKSMTSRLTYVMFMYLEKHRGLSLQWKVGIDELRRILNCESDWYATYKYFNADVLKRCQDEIHAKTETRFSYVPIKKSRKVIAIQIKLLPLSKAVVKEYETDGTSDGENKEPETEGAQNSSAKDNEETIRGEAVTDNSDNNGECDGLGESTPEYRERIELMRSACNNEFTIKEVELLYMYVKRIPEYRLPYCSTAGVEDDKILRQHHYIEGMYHEMDLHDTKKGKIINRYDYLKTMIINDVKKM